MCVIAGYAGNRPAAPILIDMLRREQFFDGGLSTGILSIRLFGASIKRAGSAAPLVLIGENP